MRRKHSSETLPEPFWKEITIVTVASSQSDPVDGPVPPGLVVLFFINSSVSQGDDDDDAVRRSTLRLGR